MADWSQLPKDLLERIGAELRVCIDILRFRSVCSSWRSSVSYPRPHSFPIRILIGPTTGLYSGGSFHLSKRLILTLTSPHNDNEGSGWIVKLQQDDVSNTSHLLNPLSDSKIQHLPSTFPRILDLINVRISELGQEYLLRFANKPPYGFAGDVYREKVAFDHTRNLLMTIHVSGKLALFNLQTSVWSVVQEMPSPYDDVVFYKGRFWAVDTSGGAVVVDSSLTVTRVANPVFGGDKKYLVELDGELLLVDRYLSIGFDEFNPDQPEIYAPNDVYNPDHPNYEIYVPNDDTYIVDITAHFKVFKLQPCDKSWVEMKSLGGRMIFLGDNCSFSASASHFNGSNGNCIYFTDRCFQSNQAEDASFKGHCIGVFNMDDASIGPLASYSGHSQLFWPPPVWLTQPSL